MLDLLIHVTAANKISPAAHLLQVTDEEGRLLPHKPSTPIGMNCTHDVVELIPPSTSCSPGSILALSALSLAAFIDEEEIVTLMREKGAVLACCPPPSSFLFYYFALPSH